MDTTKTDNDPRYTHRTCTACGHTYQLIDLGAALHVFRCPEPKTRNGR